MPAMTMTNKVYQAREQAAHMTGAAKIPSRRTPSAVTLPNCRKMQPVLIRSGGEGLVFLSGCPTELQANRKPALSVKIQVCPVRTLPIFTFLRYIKKEEL